MRKFASDFELFLNTPDPEMVRKYIDRFPISGVTCNPQMISDMKRPDFINLLKELREATGNDRKLFIQAPSSNYHDIIDDVETIFSVIGGGPACVKIPTCADGITAIMDLSAKGVEVCGTQVMSALQGICALQAGAKYISVFYGMMNMGGIDEYGLYGGSCDGKLVYDALTAYIKENNCTGKIMACAPRDAREIAYLISTGAGAITLDPFDFDRCFGDRNFQGVHKGVRAGWESVYGKTQVKDML